MSEGEGLVGPAEHSESEFLSPSHPMFFRLVVLCLSFICFSGVMSGLQIAITQITKTQLALMRKEGTKEEQKVARLLEPIIRRRHLTLVCLLIGNALAMEALPIFMDMLMPRVLAIVMSVSSVVLFSEVIPQAICLKWPLEFAGLFAWVLYVLIGTLYPFSAPIAWLLDTMFGTHGGEDHFSKSGLRQLAIDHGKVQHKGDKAVLNKHELQMILGALDMSQLRAIDKGTKLDNVFMISNDAVLNDSLLGEILKSGHSRIPVYVKGDRKRIRGLILVKQLIRIPMLSKIRDLALVRPILVANQNVSLYELFTRFCRGESHMAVLVREEGEEGEEGEELEEAKSKRGVGVCDSTVEGNQDAENCCGIITLEDVMEQMLRLEIMDETDNGKMVVDDMAKRVAAMKAFKSNTYQPNAVYGAL
ncbi:hypothetical protein BASA81_010055 [Batrachochytrium salamandrivorans]|nr:hypothetical protein BASA81_010055 [Batrachochytrium salamandrivorans]